jgi:hypothetical protein
MLTVGGMFGISDDTPVLTGWWVSHNSEIHEDTLDGPCHPESGDFPPFTPIQLHVAEIRREGKADRCIHANFRMITLNLKIR